MSEPGEPYLAGLRVLDLSRVLAGPLCTQILADLGAEVLKVEPPGGDDTRAWGPPFQGEQSAYFQSANRGKASLVVDLRREGERERLGALAAAADVVVDNYTPPVLARLGLENLRQGRERLVHLSIVGYPGSRRDDPGYDLLVQAEAGWMAITGAADGEPAKVGVAVVDVLTGMMAAVGVQAALLRRARTGCGARLELSLFRTALFSLINVATNHLVSGAPTRRWGNAHPNLVPYQPFGLADGRLVVGVGNDRQWRRLLAALDITGGALADLDNPGRLARRDEVVEVLADRFRRLPVAATAERLRAAGVPCAPLLRPDQALAAVARWDSGALLALDHRELGTVRMPANPLVGDGMAGAPAPPPRLGEGGAELTARWLAG